MKRICGARPDGSFTRSRHWISANRRSEVGVFGLEGKKTWNKPGRRVPGPEQRSSEGVAGLWIGPVFAQIVPAQCHSNGKNLATAGQAKAGAKPWASTSAS